MHIICCRKNFAHKLFLEKNVMCITRR
jgi:hypothetical protein